MKTTRHFLDLCDVGRVELRQILKSAAKFKHGKGQQHPLSGKTLAMIFEKSSTRTRVSFEVAMRQLGGDVIALKQDDLQVGRGETIADTGRVLSRYVDVILLRTAHPDRLVELAQSSEVPVINGLTDRSHPIQLLADIITYEENLGPISDARIAWCGDGNNMAFTWLQAAVEFGFELRLACPSELELDSKEIFDARAAGANVFATNDPVEAVSDASCVVTDTWVSMGYEEGEWRQRLLEPFRVDEALMKNANPNAIFMHCLPAHRGEEVSAGVLDGAQSVVWEEAENRLYAQKGILMWCLT